MPSTIYLFINLPLANKAKYSDKRLNLWDPRLPRHATIPLMILKINRGVGIIWRYSRVNVPS